MSFPLGDLLADGASKTELAQKLATYMTQNGICLPVYQDETHAERRFYSYSNQLGVWKRVDKDYALKMAKNQLGNQWTRHTKQEFMNQLKTHEHAIYFEDMGLPEEEILCRDGKVYNLETGEVRKIEKQDYALHMVNADPEGDSFIEDFEEFLEDTIPEESHRKTVQEFLGWSLKYPHGDYKKALLILGDTNSGKSTLLRIIAELFKESHVSRLSITQIAQERTFHVSNLNGSILNIDEDMSSAEIEQGSTLKKLIAQEPLFVEDKGDDGYEVHPRCKFMVASNVAPNPSTEDDRAFYQRFITLEAPDRVPEEEQDKQLVDKLTSEEALNGLFQWALEGLRRLEDQEEFSYSPDIMETRRIWNKYGSEVQKFLHECVDKEKGNHVPTVDAYEYYELWSMDKLGETISRKQFISEMCEQPFINKDRVKLDGQGRRSVFKHIDIDI